MSSVPGGSYTPPPPPVGGTSGSSDRTLMVVTYPIGGSVTMAFPRPTLDDPPKPK